ncbi:hypothetical protein HO133_001225 [Letharia lupina]|uniref:Fe2OG dioxygenase domain-containing protein n=1 Tax=Letharia lupina TaxID=560253 RepID=A0A8H6FBW0_9LECA|nr:uncharacterized protein HO133_001225 [Letharia lupina]KAF6222139.1 hypothetical protein HO133_001225 [Letharia lupina]
MDARRSNGSSLQIPVIDISEASAADTAGQLVDAVARYGFVFVRGEGIGFTKQTLDNAFALSQRFFSSTIEEKQECAIQDNNIGWSSMHSETLDPKTHFKEAMNFGEFTDGKAQQPLPPSLASHEAELYHFGVLCHELCIKLLRLFALGLRIDPNHGGKDWFSSRHDPSQGSSGSVLRLLHYPAVEMDKSLDTTVDIRAGAHSDYGSLTLLFQRASQPGLEILTRSSFWSPVPIQPSGTEDDSYPPILVNIGDLMHFWTNGLLKSTVHRVVFPEGESEDRYSIAYFCHPSDHIEIEAVPSDMIRDRETEKRQQGVKTVTAEGYLKKRLAETYGWGKLQSPERD